LNIKQSALLKPKEFIMKKTFLILPLILASFGDVSANGGIAEIVQRLRCRDIRTLRSSLTENVYVKKCHDNTHTITTAPGSRSAVNGPCGPTVGSVMLAGYCGRVFNPFDAQELGYFEDITPGTRPGTMRNSLNRLFRENSSACPAGDWTVYDTDNGYDFLNLSINRMRTQNSRYSKAPFVALVRARGLSLHYFPIVNIYFVNSSRPSTQTLKPGNPISASEREEILENFEQTRRVERSSERPRASERMASTQPSRVTSRNIGRCRVAVNDYSFQKIYTCSNFLSMMRAANNIFGLSAVYDDYTYIAFRNR
tara:strand:- start:3531 stop:4463 length:933 start_codon:yes stop_codon:yes gene_type:complete